MSSNSNAQLQFNPETSTTTNTTLFVEQAAFEVNNCESNEGR